MLACVTCVYACMFLSSQSRFCLQLWSPDDRHYQVPQLFLTVAAQKQYQMVVLVGITGKVNCKNIRHDFIGFDRLLNLTGTSEKQGFVEKTFPFQETWETLYKEKEHCTSMPKFHKFKQPPK